MSRTKNQEALFGQFYEAHVRTEAAKQVEHTKRERLMEGIAAAVTPILEAYNAQAGTTIRIERYHVKMGRVGAGRGRRSYKVVLSVETLQDTAPVVVAEFRDRFYYQDPLLRFVKARWMWPKLEITVRVKPDVAISRVKTGPR